MTESSVRAVGCCRAAGCLLTDQCIASTDATLASYDMNRVKLWYVSHLISIKSASNRSKARPEF